MKVLNKFAALGSSAPVKTANGGLLQVATTIPSSWFASTGGVYKPKGLNLSDARSFAAANRVTAR